MAARTENVVADVLDVAYVSYGEPSGWPCVLCHGFPYDVHAYAEVGPRLAAAGAWVVVPYLRGFGPTRFLRADTPRSGEQAALGGDLLALLDALRIERAVLGGYDWGGRAACVVAALWPDRVTALVSANGYNVQDIAKAQEPAPPEAEAAYWYQYYFHGERGRRGLERHRRELARLLWRMWSPTWAFDEATFELTAPAFDNRDFVDVVIHSYRHRYGLVGGDPAYAGIERQLAAQPPIVMPAISIDGDRDGVSGLTGHHARQFAGPYEHRIFGGAGHNLPQERPDAWCEAILDARRMAADAASP